MKTNKIMRVASVLLVAVLLTTCAISGTFAKYVTTGNTGDGARVAKWGIVMDSTGTATFKDTYDATVATSGTTGDAVVAPGTNNSATYTITGAPETAYTVSFAYNNQTLEEVYLGAGTYTYADAQGAVTYVGMDQTVTSNYYPIKYTVTVSTTNGTLNDGSAFTANTAKNYDTLAAALTDLAATTIAFDPNEACDVTVTIAWAWAIQNADQNANAYDTILGDLAAGNADLTKSEGAAYNLTVLYDLTVTVTQKD